MKNTSLVYEIKKTLLSNVILAISLSVIVNLLPLPLWLNITVLTSILVAFYFFAVKRVSKQTVLLPQIYSMVKEVSDGKFEGRITSIDESTELGKIAWAMNDLLDQMEAFSREIKTIVQCISQEKFYRKLQFAGMHGQLLHTMRAVDKAIILTETKSKKEKEYLERNVQILLENMNKFSQGDLTVSVQAENSDEIGKLFDGFNKVVANTKEIITAVIEAVQATASASTQISSSSEEMALGAQEQSSQTSEVAGAVEQMTRTIIETTKNITNASEKAKQAGSYAHNGGKVVGETINGMNIIADVVTNAAQMVKKLGTSSIKIGEIISVIDEIAEQTNLLALNAAIEAARAGEHGRGFAVVADEVKKLAGKTVNATSEITSMIKQIQDDTNNAVLTISKGTEEVDNGKLLVKKTEDSLKEIIKSSEEVDDNISQVATASEEQSTAAEQISKSIDGINNVTQETASGIQQIALAAEDLNKLTEGLQKLVSRFSLNNQYNQPAAKPIAV